MKYICEAIIYMAFFACCLGGCYICNKIGVDQAIKAKESGLIGCRDISGRRGYYPEERCEK